MRLQIWGSGAGEGTPAPFCKCSICQQVRALGGKNFKTRSCTLVNGHVMLDFSPDVFFNSYRYQENLQDLTAIAFTHSHIDHLASAELCMRAPDYCDIPEQQQLPIYGNETCIAEIKRQLLFDLGRMPDIFSFHTFHPFVPMQVDELQITPLPARHAPGEQAFILLLSEGDTLYLHCMDTALPEEETLAYLKGRRLAGITMDCTYGNARDQSERHMGLAANIRLKAWLLRQGVADENSHFLLSHIAHHAGMLHEEFSSLVAKDGFSAAYDGFSLQF